jgi:DNA-directed RNA polymerase specialized sigma24 family protein
MDYLGSDIVKIDIGEVERYVTPSYGVKKTRNEPDPIIVGHRRKWEGFIRYWVDRELYGRDDAETEIVMDSVYKSLKGLGKIKGKHGDASLRALIRTVTKRRCIDYIRRCESRKHHRPRFMQGIEEGGFRLPDGGRASGDYGRSYEVRSVDEIGADPLDKLEAGEFRASHKRIKKDNPISLAKKYRIKYRIDAMNLALLKGRQRRKSYRELGKAFGLSENQVHCRLYYWKKKIRGMVEKKKRLEGFVKHYSPRIIHPEWTDHPSEPDG